jgi:hypothetical protein
VDYGQHGTDARTLSLASLALGFTACSAVWIPSETAQTRRVYHRFESILAARMALVERPWKDEAACTVKRLTAVSSEDAFVVNWYEALCQGRPAPGVLRLHARWSTVGIGKGHDGARADTVY